MAGVNKDEGSLLFISMSKTFIDMSLNIFKTQTKESFTEFVNSMNKIYHNLNGNNITEFYLNNVKNSDSYSIKWKLFDFTGDVIITCPTYHFAKRYAELSSPETNIYFYQLNHIMRNIIPFTDIGVYHLAELEFVFGSALVNPSSTSEVNVEFSKEIIKLWTDFAKYGYELRLNFINYLLIICLNR